MVQIRWTQEAATWLEDIFNFISRDSPESAARVAAGIYEKSQILKEFPAAGHLLRVEAEGAIRVLLFGHYRVAYLFRDADGLVEILGVFHGALDIERYL